MIETVAVTDHVAIPWSRLLNPVWWLQSTGDATMSWTAPEINNGEAYLPSISNQFLRNLLWWFRNPAGNFVGFVIGVDGCNYTVTGTAPVLATTGKDCVPVQEGWRYALINLTYTKLPFVSYYRKGVVEFYFGWRPASGGFGLKLVKG